MEVFKPECTIQICIHTWGKPAKIAYGITLTDAKARALVEFSHFLGISTLAGASMQAAKLAMEQALRLKFEKIELRGNSSFQVDFLKDQARVPREEALKSIFVDCEHFRNSFRFFRFLQVPEEQMQEASRLAKGVVK